MPFIKQISLSCVILALSCTEIQGSIFTIEDDRVRNMDIAPVLGRGYSIMTNQYHSTCLDVKTVQVPSYDYDCKFLLLG